MGRGIKVFKLFFFYQKNPENNKRPSLLLETHIKIIMSKVEPVHKLKSYNSKKDCLYFQLMKKSRQWKHLSIFLAVTVYFSDSLKV